ncbi:hypothetical protein Esti_005831 [Eimeria stiedai]
MGGDSISCVGREDRGELRSPMASHAEPEALHAAAAAAVAAAAAAADHDSEGHLELVAELQKVVDACSWGASTFRDTSRELKGDSRGTPRSSRRNSSGGWPQALNILIPFEVGREQASSCRSSNRCTPDEEAPNAAAPAAATTEATAAEPTTATAAEPTTVTAAEAEAGKAAASRGKTRGRASAGISSEDSSVNNRSPRASSAVKVKLETEKQQELSPSPERVEQRSEPGPRSVARRGGKRGRKRGRPSFSAFGAGATSDGDTFCVDKAELVSPLEQHSKRREKEDSAAAAAGRRESSGGSTSSRGRADGETTLPGGLASDSCGAAAEKGSSGAPSARQQQGVSKEEEEDATAKETEGLEETEEAQQRCELEVEPKPRGRRSIKRPARYEQFISDISHEGDDSRGFAAAAVAVSTSHTPGVRGRPPNHRRGRGGGAAASAGAGAVFAFPREVRRREETRALAEVEDSALSTDMLLQHGSSSSSNFSRPFFAAAARKRRLLPWLDFAAVEAAVAAAARKEEAMTTDRAVAAGVAAAAAAAAAVTACGQARPAAFGDTETAPPSGYSDGLEEVVRRARAALCSKAETDQQQQQQSLPLADAVEGHEAAPTSELRPSQSQQRPFAAACAAGEDESKQEQSQQQQQPQAQQQQRQEGGGAATGHWTTLTREFEAAAERTAREAAAFVAAAQREAGVSGGEAIPVFPEMARLFLLKHGRKPPVPATRAPPQRAYQQLQVIQEQLLEQHRQHRQRQELRLQQQRRQRMQQLPHERHGGALLALNFTDQEILQFYLQQRRKRQELQQQQQQQGRFVSSQQQQQQQRQLLDRQPGEERELVDLALLRSIISLREQESSRTASEERRAAELQQQPQRLLQQQQQQRQQRQQQQWQQQQLEEEQQQEQEEEEHEEEQVEEQQEEEGQQQQQRVIEQLQRLAMLSDIDALFSQEGSNFSEKAQESASPPPGHQGLGDRGRITSRSPSLSSAEKEQQSERGRERSSLPLLSPSEGEGAGVGKAAHGLGLLRGLPFSTQGRARAALVEPSQREAAVSLHFVSLSLVFSERDGIEVNLAACGLERRLSLTMAPLSPPSAPHPEFQMVSLKTTAPCVSSGSSSSTEQQQQLLLLQQEALTAIELGTVKPLRQLIPLEQWHRLLRDSDGLSAVYRGLREMATRREIKGVRLEAKKQEWIAAWTDPARRERRRYFSIRQNGDAYALYLAITTRADAVEAGARVRWSVRGSQRPEQPSSTEASAS